MRKSFRFTTNVIGVGNLSVGGTGKTPMIDYLIRYLQRKDLNIATLSRGYGRRTSGFRMASEGDTPKTLGDEPYMYFYKYSYKVNVAVGAERDLAIPEILFHRPDTDVILLDDAYQHRSVSPSLNILLTTYDRPFYRDYILPSGLLRERRSASARADIIIVTKCPASLSEADQVKVREEIGKHADATVFFTSIAYGDPQPIFDNGRVLQNQVVGISGIAQPRPFNDYLKSNYRCKLIHNYKDHHRYTRQDVKDIANELDYGISLVTTEKDMVKLKDFAELSDYSCYYIPISVRFLRDETLFHFMVDSMFKNHAEKKD